MSARLGKPDEALRQASQLDGRVAARPGAAEDSQAAELAQYSALILRAQVAYDRGDYDEAFRLLERVRPGDSWRLVATSVLLSQGHERYLWGQVLAALAVRKR